MNDYHVPVLLKEAVEYLNIRSGKKYIDCTLGGGGHTAEILRAGGTVLGIDQDTEAIDFVEENKKEEIREKKLVLKQGNFAHLQQIATETGFSPVSGILFDLGVSSHQLETGYRGFSFAGSLPARLDMRMDPGGQTVTAADFLNAGSENELANLFWRFGEERDSRRIARAIVRYRSAKKIETTDELVKIILSVSRRGKRDRTHPATRTFQALRIAVNDEMANLEAALPQATELLASGGRLVVVSFHSLEDGIVKDFMKANIKLLQNLTAKPIVPTPEEIEANPRARSGKLRAAEKL